VSGALLTDLFPARLPYSNVALSANVANVVSGFVRLLATALLTVSDGRSWMPALLLVVIALITAGSARSRRGCRSDTTRWLPGDPVR
jgi:hypothetical protein